MSLLRLVAEHFVHPGDVCARGPRKRASSAEAAPHPASPDTALRPASPGTAPPTARAARVASGPALALLCAPADAPVLGAALGLALARERRCACALVCVWTGAPPARAAWRAPALPAARRVVANLAGRGHEARAAGRLALVRLPPDCGEAASAALRATAAAGTAPTVLALGGPRAAAFDAILEMQDLVAVASRPGIDSALARLAVAGLVARAVPACTCGVPTSAPARALALAGITLLPAARSVVAATVQVLR